MRRAATRTAAGVVGIVLALVTAAALVATLTVAADLRRSLAENALSRLWGEPVQVRGAVEITLWPQPVFQLHDVVSARDGAESAVAQRVDIALSTYQNLFTDTLIYGIALTGARFDIPLAGATGASPGSLLSSPIYLLSVLPRLRIQDVVLVFADAARGWRFELQIDQLRGGPQGDQEVLNASGLLNGTPVTFGFVFDVVPDAARAPLPYGAVITLGAPGLEARLDVRAPDPTFNRDLSLALSAQSDSLAKLLVLAGVAPSIDGTGTLTAQLRAEPDALAMDDLKLNLQLPDDETVQVTGSVGNLVKRQGIDLSVVAETAPGVAPAVSLREITITRLSGRFTNARRGVKLNDIIVRTNAFAENLREIGPIEVGSITRDPEGRVAFRDISILAGPDDAPLFKLTGSVTDILAFTGVKLAGTIDMPLGEVISLPKGAGELGQLVGEIAVSDGDGTLGIDELTAEIQGSPLFAASVKLLLDDLPRTQGPPRTEVQTAFSTPNVGALAEAIGLSSDFNGPARFEGTLSGNADALRGEGKGSIGRTTITGFLTSTAKAERQVIGGEIKSPVVYADEILALVRRGKPPREPFSISVVGASRIEDSKLDVVGTTDADIQVQASRIQGAVEGASGINARLRLANGEFSANPVQVTYAGGRITAAVTSEGRSVLRAKGSGEGWPLSSFFERDGKFSASGTVRLSFDVTSRVAEGADPLRTLDGTVLARVNNGRLGTGLLDLAGLGIFGGLFNPAVIEGQSVLHCVRIPLTFKNGIGRTDPVIVVETDNVRALAQGTVDPADNAINLFVVPRPLNSSAAGYSFTVKGRLNAPAVALATGSAPAVLRGNYSCGN